VYTGAITGPGSSTYRLFKLGSCKPSQAAATVNSVEELSVGKIVVKIDKVVDTGRVQQRLNITAAAPSRDAADKKLPEGKKVSLQLH
jgi:ribosomal protein L18E